MLPGHKPPTTNCSNYRTGKVLSQYPVSCYMSSVKICFITINCNVIYELLKDTYCITIYCKYELPSDTCSTTIYCNILYEIPKETCSITIYCTVIYHIPKDICSITIYCKINLSSLRTHVLSQYALTCYMSSFRNHIISPYIVPWYISSLRTRLQFPLHWPMSHGPAGGSKPACGSQWWISPLYASGHPHHSVLEVTACILCAYRSLILPIKPMRLSTARVKPMT